MAQTVWQVVTEVNGYRNFYGCLVFRDKDRADRLRGELIDGGKFDDVYVVAFSLV